MSNKFLKTFIFLITLLIFASVSCTQSNNKNSFEKSIKLEKPKDGEVRYKYVPFEVPENTKSILIVPEYDKKAGKNRIEFGVFDAKFDGENTDKRGFRGWSGSVRDRIFLDGFTTTRGYASQEIEAGKWYVILGLASIAEDGVEVKIRIKFNQDDEQAKKQYYEEEMRTFSFKQNEKLERTKTGDFTWFAGDLHAHTFHGDGRWSVLGILESAKSNNLDFVAITEHNTFTHHQDIETNAKDYPNILVLKGQEVTTYGGHINVWGLPYNEWVDFRVLPNREESAKRIAEEANKLGAIVSINHPTMGCDGCNWTYGDWTNMASVEIWNATWDSQDESALKQWDKNLRKGIRVTAIGSSDSHQRPEEPSKYPTNLAIGEPSVFVGATSKTEKNLFEAIKKGRVFVAENSRRSIELSANESTGIGEDLNISKGENVSLNFTVRGFPKGSIVKLISSGGVFYDKNISSDSFNDVVKFEAIEDTYYRLEVRSKEGLMLGFTNPIFLNIRG